MGGNKVIDQSFGLGSTGLFQEILNAHVSEGQLAVSPEIAKLILQELVRMNFDRTGDRGLPFEHVLVTQVNEIFRDLELVDKYGKENVPGARAVLPHVPVVASAEGCAGGAVPAPASLFSGAPRQAFHAPKEAGPADSRRRGCRPGSRARVRRSRRRSRAAGP